MLYTTPTQSPHRQMTRRLSNHQQHRLIRLLITALILTALILTAACQTSQPLLTGELPINAPTAITVGDSVDVTVGPVTVTDGTRVGLVMVGKHGPRIYRGEFERGFAHFIIPGEHTLQPGYLAIIAAADSARGEVGVLLRPKAEYQSSSYQFRPPTP